MISQEKADFIRSLADASGHIEPRAVVEASRSPNAPTHTDFPWDVETAASEHWLDCARRLIRFVKLKIEIDRRVIVAPYYVPDPDREPRSRRYLGVPNAMGDEPAKQKRIIDDELERIASQIRRVIDLGAVFGLSEYVEEQLTDVTQLRTATERRKEEQQRAREARRAKQTKGRKRKPPRGRPEARV